MHLVLTILVNNVNQVHCNMEISNEFAVRLIKAISFKSIFKTVSNIGKNSMEENYVYRKVT